MTKKPGQATADEEMGAETPWFLTPRDRDGFRRKGTPLAA
jgi:hypothetical protein